MFKKIIARFQQREIMDEIINIHNKMDILDNGYHNGEINQLAKESNELCELLTKKNLKKIQNMYE